jgi:hypothetical protein
MWLVYIWSIFMLTVSVSYSLCKYCSETESVKTPLKHIFPQMSNIYLNRDIKSVSELNWQRLYNKCIHLFVNKLSSQVEKYVLFPASYLSAVVRPWLYLENLCPMFLAASRKKQKHATILTYKGKTSLCFWNVTHTAFRWVLKSWSHHI